MRYVMDGSPGLKRVGSGRAFRFLNRHGRTIRHPREVERLRRLAIPPAWTSVWICPDPHGHIQATGRDARGRKQYRYHPDWRATRDGTKFEHMIAFAQALPKIRRRVAQDLRTPGLGQAKIIAAMVQLLELTHIRVGNEEYAKQNHSFGLTTLRDRHVKIRGDKLHFTFLGKSGKTHEIELHDRRLSRIVRRTQELPGQELFQYLDHDGVRRKITSDDVNRYLQEASGGDFTAKDFRTWAGTVMAALALDEIMKTPEARPTKRNLQAAITKVAERLGNTPTICRKCYIHPLVMDRYLAGETLGLLRPNLANASPQAGWRLGMEEMAVLNFLRTRLKRSKTPLNTLLKKSVKQQREKRLAA